MLGSSELTFLLIGSLCLLLFIGVVLWLTEPDPYEDDEDEILDEKPPCVCVFAGGCVFGEDIGMPEHKCKGVCGYKETRKK